MIEYRVVDKEGMWRLSQRPPAWWDHAEPEHAPFTRQSREVTEWRDVDGD